MSSTVEASVLCDIFDIISSLKPFCPSRSASFENCGLNSGTLGASAKEVWRLLCCGDASPNTCCGKWRRGDEPKAGDYPSGGNTTLSTPCVG